MNEACPPRDLQSQEIGQSMLAFAQSSANLSIFGMQINHAARGQTASNS